MIRAMDALNTSHTMGKVNLLRSFIFSIEVIPMSHRLTALRAALGAQHLDALFVIRGTNLRYLTGFTGADSFALITPSRAFFITDSRYTEQASQECPLCEVVPWRDPYASLPETLRRLTQREGVLRLGFEKRFVNYGLYEELAAELSGVALVPTEHLVEGLRYVKDTEEQQALRRAAEVADRAFAKLVPFLAPGRTEREVAAELEYILRREGAEGIAFDPIVASGPHSSMPHAVPSNRALERGDFLTLDFGAQWGGYRSDMTRTVVIGKASPRQRELYARVLASQQAGLGALRSGVPGNEVDAASRRVLEGQEGIFSYGVGHGVGLDIHEEPFMKKSCTRLLEPGCIVTVEPGLYLPGEGGIRIEDTAMVREEGCEVLTRSSRELLEL